MCRTQHGEPRYDSLTTTIQSEYLYTTGYNPTSPKIVVGTEPETQASTQPTPERSYDESNTLGTLLMNVKMDIILTLP